MIVSLQAKPYRNNPEIVAMTNLVSAYQNDDIVGFEEILKSNRYALFIKNYFEELSITFYWFFIIGVP